jgi:threonine/homoserine/homoserine lactone efflux protein
MVVAIVAALFVGAGSVLGVLLFVVAAIMGVTAAVGTCPLYRIFHISTCPVRRAH